MMLFLLPVMNDAEGSGRQLDLRQAWTMASSYDARYRVAQADYQMQRKEVPKALSGYLPNIYVQASRGRRGTIRELTDPNDRKFYSSKSYGVYLSQSVVDIQTIAAYKGAVALEGKSAMVLENEKGNLMARTIEAYCNALFSQEAISVSRSLVALSQEEVARAVKASEQGVGTVIAIDEARAKYEASLAEEQKGLNSHEHNLRELEKLTGVYAGKLAPLSPVLDQKPIALKTEDEWIAAALKMSPEMGAVKKDLDMARWQTAKTRAGGYPTLDLVASWSYSANDTDYNLNEIYDTYAVSLQLKVPIYSGGYVMSSVSQSKMGQLKAQENFSWKERQIVSDVRKYYRGLQSLSMLINANKRTVDARNTLLKSKQKGLLSGVATRMDVLDARQQLRTSELELSKSRFQYILNLVMLEKTAGMLGSDDIVCLASGRTSR
ncbi:TolC family protein [Pelodictyon luteolum]|nr:TolC family protein [Pelodictyon luteolum]